MSNVKPTIAFRVPKEIKEAWQKAVQVSGIRSGDLFEALLKDSPLVASKARKDLAPIQDGLLGVLGQVAALVEDLRAEADKVKETLRQEKARRAELEAKETEVDARLADARTMQKGAKDIEASLRARIGELQGTAEELAETKEKLNLAKGELKERKKSESQLKSQIRDLKKSVAHLEKMVEGKE